MIRFKNFIECITKVTVIIFLSSEISLANFDDGMDAINKGNYEQAITELKPLADQGDARAQFWYGNLIFNGLGTPKNMKLGIEFYRLSAEKNFPLALHELGHIYDNGLGVEQDIDEAINWYEKAITEGRVVYSYHNLGMIYQYGSKNIEVNVDKAIELYKEAANQNYLGSIQNLGIIYHQIKDYDKALKWLNKAADLGLPQANYVLMEMYLNGDGVKQDFGEGIRLAKLAADSGYYLAQHNLGRFYHFGLVGLEKDYKAARKWYKLAANQGFSNSQVNLGILYDDGLGVEVDDKEAIRFFKLAFDQQNATAAYRLGLMHEFGEGTPQNYELANEYYDYAIQDDHPEALYRIAMLWKKMGINQGKPQTLALYLAAQLKQIDAMFELGMIYYNGNEFLKPNPIYSLMWFMLASNYHEQATKNRDVLIEELSEDEVEKALKLQERCYERDFQNCSDLLKG